jgi:hypothetical protein
VSIGSDRALELLARIASTAAKATRPESRNAMVSANFEMHRQNNRLAHSAVIRTKV